MVLARPRAGSVLGRLGVSTLFAAALVTTGVTPVMAQAGALALIKPPRVSPDSAAAARKPVQDRATAMMRDGDARSAAMELDIKAAELADPMLFLDAAEAYYQAGDKDRHIPSVEAGIERAHIALDILHFMQDPGVDKTFLQVAKWQVGSLLQRANDHVRKSNELIEAIQTEEASALDEPGDEPKKKKVRSGSGRGMLIGGAVLTGLGIAGLGVGVAGLAIGTANQNNVEDPTVYGEEYDDFEAKGKRGNLLAYGGLIGGGVLAAVGVTLVILAVKRNNSSPAAAEEEPIVRVTPALSPRANGLVVSGRF